VYRSNDKASFLAYRSNDIQLVTKQSTEGWHYNQDDFLDEKREALELLARELLLIWAKARGSGILLRHSWQTYFGLFDGTYIFVPHSQNVRPAKR